MPRSDCQALLCVSAASAEKPFGVSIVVDKIVYGTGMAASKKAAKNAAGACVPTRWGGGGR